MCEKCGLKSQELARRYREILDLKEQLRNMKIERDRYFKDTTELQNLVNELNDENVFLKQLLHQNGYH
ncbi:MAG: hypothetical protein LBR15_06360 [Methanobrevibacter sp.]|jgi:hypothetical protein|nr:hypothetical protein [Candidatus Methanovirga australis]